MPLQEIHRYLTNVPFGTTCPFDSLSISVHASISITVGITFRHLLMKIGYLVQSRPGYRSVSTLITDRMTIYKICQIGRHARAGIANHMQPCYTSKEVISALGCGKPI
jgi:hypothetical protein